LPTKVRRRARPTAAPKPKYPSRLLLNLFVFFLLLVFIGGFSVVFLDLYSLNLPRPRTFAELTKDQIDRKRKEDQIKLALHELEGNWIVQSAIPTAFPRKS